MRRDEGHSRGIRLTLINRSYPSRFTPKIHTFGRLISSRPINLPRTRYLAAYPNLRLTRSGPTMGAVCQQMSEATRNCVAAPDGIRKIFP